MRRNSAAAGRSGEEAQDESDADAPAGEAQALAPEQVDRTALPIKT